MSSELSSGDAAFFSDLAVGHQVDPNAYGCRAICFGSIRSFCFWHRFDFGQLECSLSRHFAYA